MRKRPIRKIEKYRIKNGTYRSRASEGCNGMFKVGHVTVIASDGGGWDHVSVTVQKDMKQRCPTWEEMETVRGWFWEDHETVIQFSPPLDAEKVNFHPYCLHMWKNQSQDVELPPTIMVGPVTHRALTDDEKAIVNHGS